MQRYKLVTWQEWKKTEEQQLKESPKGELIKRSPYYFNFNVELFPRVKYFYDKDYYPIIDYCIKHPEYCVDFYSTLQKFGLPYSSYYREMKDKVRKVFFEALVNHKIVILRLPTPIVHVAPKTRIEPIVSQPQLIMSKPIRKWDDENEQFIEFEPNWIQIDLRSHPHHPYTVLNPSDGKIIASGRLNSSGFIDIDLPIGIDKVNVYLGEYREWEKEQLLQINTAAYQATTEFLDNLYEYTKLAPELTQEQQQILVDNINHLHDPKSFPDTPKPVVTSRSFLQDIYHFLVSYLQALKSVSFIYPIIVMGQVSRSQVAGCIHADLMGVLRKSSLNNRALEDYFKAPINDSEAYERFKQATENEDLGELVKVFHPLMRSVKYATLKPFFKQVQTRGRYDLRVQPLEVAQAEAKERNWIELEFEPNACFTLADANGESGSILSGKLDAQGFAHIEIPPAYQDVKEFDVTFTNEFEFPCHCTDELHAQTGHSGQCGSFIVATGGESNSQNKEPLFLGITGVMAISPQDKRYQRQSKQADITLLSYQDSSQKYPNQQHCCIDLNAEAQKVEFALKGSSFSTLTLELLPNGQNIQSQTTFTAAPVNQWHGLRHEKLTVRHRSFIPNMLYKIFSSLVGGAEAAVPMWIVIPPPPSSPADPQIEEANQVIALEVTRFLNRVGQGIDDFILYLKNEKQLDQPAIQKLPVDKQQLLADEYVKHLTQPAIEDLASTNLVNCWLKKCVI